jgi:phosphoribosyl-ATP pyrophosphohydrolase
MAIQIRELIVKANIDRQAEAGKDSGISKEDIKAIKQQVIEEAMEGVLAMLENEKLR